MEVWPRDRQLDSVRPSVAFVSVGPEMSETCSDMRSSVGSFHNAMSLGEQERDYYRACQLPRSHNNLDRRLLWSEGSR
jgi:hypothetical protein